MTKLHGTCVALKGRAVLLVGPPGSGKSDLALRLIDRGFQLVADDQVAINVYKKTLIVSAPHEIKDLIEMRGIGIIPNPSAEEAILELVVELTAREAVERLPDDTIWSHQSIDIRSCRLHAFDASTPLKIEFLLNQLALGAHCDDK